MHCLSYLIFSNFQKKNGLNKYHLNLKPTKESQLTFNLKPGLIFAESDQFWSISQSQIAKKVGKLCALSILFNLIFSNLIYITISDR